MKLHDSGTACGRVAHSQDGETSFATPAGVDSVSGFPTRRAAKGDLGDPGPGSPSANPRLRAPSDQSEQRKQHLAGCDHSGMKCGTMWIRRRNQVFQPLPTIGGPAPRGIEARRRPRLGARQFFSEPSYGQQQQQEPPSAIQAALPSPVCEQGQGQTPNRGRREFATRFANAGHDAS
jgi:hypothetical protein